MESAAGSVKSHMQNSDGEVVSSQDLVRYGPRSAIDSAIRHLIRKKIIMRVASGAFVLRDGLRELPSAQQIIEAKARAFGKTVVPAASNDSKEFWTDGCRSSFNSIHGRLKFRTRSPRKLKQLSRSRKDKNKANSTVEPEAPEEEIKNESGEASPLNSIALRLLSIINTAGIRLSQIAYAGHWNLERNCLIYDLPASI